MNTGYRKGPARLPVIFPKLKMPFNSKGGLACLQEAAIYLRAVVANLQACPQVVTHGLLVFCHKIAVIRLNGLQLLGSCFLLTKLVISSK